MNSNYCVHRPRFQPALFDCRQDQPRPAALSKSQLGSFYTPCVLARWAADLLVRQMPCDESEWIVDPACGDGALLSAVAERHSLLRILGFDLDSHALDNASVSLGSRATLVHADALAIDDKALSQISGDRRPKYLIANPPWGAQIALTKHELNDLGYSVARGQYDSFDIFVEWGLQRIAVNGAMVLILPDSIFSMEHTAIRRLLSAFRLNAIYRLGEGMFKGVFRGTVLVSVSLCPAEPDHRVNCLRLDQTARKQFLSGKTDFRRLEELYVHQIPQSRLLSDGQNKWDIDLATRDLPAMTKIGATLGTAWSSGLITGRGVEISKTGKVVICGACGFAAPNPKEYDSSSCNRCGVNYKEAGSTAERIIDFGPVEDGASVSFICGEDVDRHQCQPRRHLKLNVRGINYKHLDDFIGPKLLVRKTGVGLKSCLDTSGSFTNQVVFHFRFGQGSGLPNWYLAYLEGVLCSRVLFAFYLKKYGESEWRSHPYLTQSILASLPIVRPYGPQLVQAEMIADAVKIGKVGSGFDISQDLLIDRLVAGLYGLTSKDCAWVLETLNSAQPLEPMRALRLPESTIFEPLEA
jgi:hypothetical protein